MLALVWFTAAALASSRYPSDVESTLEMPCAPECTLCHATNSGGSGTVVSEFGLAMLDHGLDGGSRTDLLVAALDGLATDQVDSDGDGVLDVDELAAGDDPNGDASICETATPIYGCFDVARAPMAPLGLLAVGLAIRRRQRDR